ncbi:MAG: hypothetical protein AAGC47_14970 [Bacteroidota bacterium]
MKNILVIFSSVLSILVFGQPNDTLFYQNDGGIKRIIDWNDSLEHHFYLSGAKEAVYRLFSRNELTSIDPFHLQSKEWFEEGTLKMENRLSQDTIIHLTYFENGALEFRSKKVPDVNEEYDFVFQASESYCANGQLKSLIELPKTRDFGYEEFHCNGQLAICADSTDIFGYALGIISRFDENGSLTEVWKTKQYSRTQQDIVWIKKYDQKGNLLNIEYFGENNDTKQKEE